MRRTDPHAVLADPTRRALLAVLREADGPLGVRAIALRVGLHPNSAREQLRHLEDGGFVHSSTAPSSGRGRPGLRYRLSSAAEAAAEPWRTLGTALADELLEVPGAEGVWAAAGERWGRRAAAGADAEGTAGDRLADLLADAGFAPDAPRPGDTELRLRACPFLPLERHHLPVVCGMHLGFISGALHELGSHVEAIAIEPFVQPDLCVARFGSPILD
jgi:predicted ArsR family transcriptional regulator